MITVVCEFLVSPHLNRLLLGTEEVILFVEAHVENAQRGDVGLMQKDTSGRRASPSRGLSIHP